MSRRDIGTDDPRVRVRPGKGSRPRTKRRPDFSDATYGFVTEVDRGRFTVVTETGTTVQAVKARALGRKGVLVGDRVGLQGDLSGQRDTLARIVFLRERETVLRRSFDETESATKEKLIVANATQLLIVVAAANPTPRRGMIDRAMVAAISAGVSPMIVVTKTDLEPATNLIADYRQIGIPVFATRRSKTSCQKTEMAGMHCARANNSPLLETDNQIYAGDFEIIEEQLKNQVTVLLGHSGVGKSTLVNAIVTDANRATGQVNDVTGKGRHTSSSAVAFPVECGWVIDTPGVRSLGLGHLNQEELLSGFPELMPITAECPRGCTHRVDSPDCQLDVYPELRKRVESFRGLLEGIPRPY